MNTNDLYLEYARVIKMCEGTKLEDRPWVCVRWRWKMSVEWFDFPGHPNFSETNPSIFRKDVDFAVAVLEGRPVFVGDRVYAKDAKSENHPMSEGALVEKTGESGAFVEFKNGSAFSISVFNNELDPHFTWTPPKRTFTLNGVE